MTSIIKEPRRRVKWISNSSSHQNKQKKHDGSNSMNGGGNSNPNDISDIMIGGGVASGNASVIPGILSKLKLLIVYARDCPAHEKVVENFAKYMELDMIGEQFRSHSSAYNKFTMAYFSYTSSAHILNHISRYVRFELPRNLESLAGYLHNLRPPKPGETHHPLYDCNSQTYISSCEGRQFLLEFHHFEEEQPKWFENLHVRVANTSSSATTSEIMKHSNSLELSVGDHSADTMSTSCFINEEHTSGIMDDIDSGVCSNGLMQEPSESKVDTYTLVPTDIQNFDCCEAPSSTCSERQMNIELDSITPLVQKPLELRIDCCDVDGNLSDELSALNPRCQKGSPDRLRMLDSGFHDGDSTNSNSVSSSSLDNKGDNVLGGSTDSGKLSNLSAGYGNDKLQATYHRDVQPLLNVEF